jgi:hypothetical protein
MAIRDHGVSIEGPFLAEQLRSGDPYELSNGHALYCTPTGQRGGKANLHGGQVLGSDPKVESAGVDVGYSAGPKELRAPDVAVGNVGDEPGWAKKAPPLAVEYADVGQDEAQLQLKIGELFAAGTQVLWVVRLTGQPHVEVHEPGKAMRIAAPGDVLRAEGILANPVPVEALYERDAAHDATLRNLLNRKGYRDLADVQLKGREEGREEATKLALHAILSARGIALTPAQQSAIADARDATKLAQWVTAAATAQTSADIFT